VAAGAAGFVDKYNDDFGVLAQAVDEIGRNGYIVTDSLHNALRKLARKCPDVRLSDALEETLVLLEKGMKDIDIAKKLCLSPRTIEDHKRKILKEFGYDIEGRTSGFADLTRELGIGPGDIVNDRAGHRPRRELIARAMPWHRRKRR
jgi:DNA-binding NarL/FixJ family response regulator